jgi:hypothetical protein
VLRRLALVALLPSTVVARRNSTTLTSRLDAMSSAAGDRPELLPVCSCCRARALRPRGTGRTCPTCDTAPPEPPPVPNRRPPGEEGTLSP